jgi:probable F420-dependent oxidoreductase
VNLTKVPLVQHEPAILTGVSKFILQPLGSDDDTILAQTHLLIEQVLPRAERGGRDVRRSLRSRDNDAESVAGPRSASNATRERTMRIGGAMFFTDYSMSPTELARALEDRGFDSLWVPEHSHIPVTRKSPFPSGGDLPKKYYDVMDPFVMLGAAAAVTKTLLLGTGICLIAQRDPLQTAKQVASIDQISSGRFLFGIGNGWNEDEMANHGTAFASRHQLARERVEAMKVIWTESKAEYHGEFVNFDPMMTWPKPVQKPHPPIIVGGAFPHGARRALRYGNGWMPHRSRTQYADVQALLPKFREMAAEAGRDPTSVPITIWGAKESLDLLKRDRDDRVSRVVVSLDSGKADMILPELDRWATLIRQLGS